MCLGTLIGEHWGESTGEAATKQLWCSRSLLLMVLKILRLTSFPATRSRQLTQTTFCLGQKEDFSSPYAKRILRTRELYFLFPVYAKEWLGDVFKHQLLPSSPISMTSNKQQKTPNQSTNLKVQYAFKIFRLLIQLPPSGIWIKWRLSSRPMSLGHLYHDYFFSVPLWAMFIRQKILKPSKRFYNLQRARSYPI